MLSLFTHCLRTLSASLYSKGLISQSRFDAIFDDRLSEAQRSQALIKGVEAVIEKDPLKFNQFVEVLRSDRLLELLVSKFNFGEYNVEL